MVAPEGTCGPRVKMALTIPVSMKRALEELPLVSEELAPGVDELEEEPLRIAAGLAVLGATWASTSTSVPPSPRGGKAYPSLSTHCTVSPTFQVMTGWRSVTRTVKPAGRETLTFTEDRSGKASFRSFSMSRGDTWITEIPSTFSTVLMSLALRRLAPTSLAWLSWKKGAFHMATRSAATQNTRAAEIRRHPRRRLGITGRRSSAPAVFKGMVTWRFTRLWVRWCSGTLTAPRRSTTPRGLMTPREVTGRDTAARVGWLVLRLICCWLY